MLASTIHPLPNHLFAEHVCSQLANEPGFTVATMGVQQELGVAKL